MSLRVYVHSTATQFVLGIIHSLSFPRDKLRSTKRTQRIHCVKVLLKARANPILASTASASWIFSSGTRYCFALCVYVRVLCVYAFVCMCVCVCVCVRRRVALKKRSQLKNTRNIPYTPKMVVSK